MMRILQAGLCADEILALVMQADARPQADRRETIRLTTLAGHGCGGV